MKNQDELIAVGGLASSEALNTLVVVMQDKLSEDELKQLKLKVGRCMEKIYTEIMKPIWEESPELLPKEMGGSFSYGDSLQPFKEQHLAFLNNH